MLFTFKLFYDNIKNIKSELQAKRSRVSELQYSRFEILIH